MDLIELIGRLPVHERLVVTLYYLDDLSANEIADFTGRTETGVRMGTTVEQIEKAYGPPDVKNEAPEGSSWLYYKSLHTAFDVRKDRLWQLSLDKE